MTPVDRLLARANPVPTPSPGQVTPVQERLLASIVAAPPRRRRSAAVRLMVAAPAVAAVALVFVLVFGRGATVNDETDATRGGTAGAGNGDVIHVVTRLYGEIYGPGLGERLDGWLEPSSGRARIVITTDGDMTLQQVVDADDRVRSWQGALGNANGLTDDRTAPRLAANLRSSIRDRMTSLVAFAKEGFRRDNTTLGATTTEPGEYRGRPVTIHRIAPTTGDGKPSGYYFKWYSDPTNGEVIAFERGPVRGGKDVVDQGEELEQRETLARDEAPLHELDWQTPPAVPGVTLTPPAPGPTPTPGRSGAAPTPTPSATPTPATSGAAPTPTPSATPTPAMPSATPMPVRPGATAGATPVPDPTFP